MVEAAQTIKQPLRRRFLAGVSGIAEKLLRIEEEALGNLEVVKDGYAEFEAAAPAWRLEMEEILWENIMAGAGAGVGVLGV